MPDSYCACIVPESSCGCYCGMPNNKVRKREPEIRFPFRQLDRQASFCSLPGFDLTCTADNRTTLKLPHSADTYVRSIDYTDQQLQICCPFNGTITPLNLSFSPFLREDLHGDILFFNCGSSDALREGKDFFENLYSVDCYKSSHIYASQSNFLIYMEPPFCERLETKAKLATGIYNVEDDVCCVEKLLSLSWINYPDCGSCKVNGQMCYCNISGSGDHCRSCREKSSECLCVLQKVDGGLGTAAIIGISATIIFSAILAACFGFWNHKFGGYWELDQIEVEKFLDSYQSLNPKRYSYTDVKRMTRHFRQKLGQGGFGSVYRGRLPNGLPVAVKIIETSQSNGGEFLNEVATVGRVHHVNVVRLLGFCAERFKRALVYEFMPNGSLEKFIFSSESKPCELEWDKLHEIAMGIARGIEYLHQGCDQRILHFDIKPHNILLDHKFTPKISDFGLAKFCSKEQSIVSMTAARGTAGYIAPEVVSRNFGNISYKSDVYSFGMMLLEMVGKRKNIDVNVEQTSQVYFPEWVYNRVNLHQEIGPGAITDEEDEIARKLVITALWCIQLNPADRPNMKKVVQMLEGTTSILEMPPNPFDSSTT